MKPINIDADIHNADWTKRTWDILPANAETLLETLHVARTSKAIQRRALKQFMKLPAAQALPEELKRELQDMKLLP